MPRERGGAARLPDHPRRGSTAAYLLDVDDTLSLIAGTGMTIPMGTITQVDAGDITGSQGAIGLALNSKGQVALAAKLDGGVDTLVLLTPGGPKRQKGAARPVLSHGAAANETP